MLIDFRTSGAPAAIETDLCIVGSGAAGIAMAVSMMASRQRVCVLESGGLEPKAATQSLYDGESVGQPSSATTMPRITAPTSRARAR